MSPTHEPTDPIARLLLGWQSTGDERKLRELLDEISPVVEQVARHVLRSAGIADPGAIDDAISKVFDHLRRLHVDSAEDRGVALFRSTCRDHASMHHDPAAGAPVQGDAGVAFVRWLAKERARDIARATLRRGRRVRLFSQVDLEDPGIFRKIEARDRPGDETPRDDLRRAMESLDDRARLVVERLLDGETQAAIALGMGVCEGTVSRIRTKAISTLRSAIEKATAARPGRRSPK